MEQKLILNNGAILNNSYVLRVGRNLWVYVYDNLITFADMFYLLNNPENVSRITMVQGTDQTVFEEYTDLFSVSKEEGGFLTAGLRKE